MRLISGIFVVKVAYLKQRPNGYWWYHRRVPKNLRAHFPSEWIQKALGTKDESEAIRRHANFHAEVEAKFQALLKADSAKVPHKDTNALALALLASMDMKPGDGQSSKYLGGPLEDPVTLGEITRDHFDTYAYKKYGDRFYEALEGDRGDGSNLAAVLSPVDLTAFHLLHNDNPQPSLYLSDAVNLYLKHHSKGDSAKFKAPIFQALNIVKDVLGDLPLESIRRPQAQAIRDAMINAGHKTASIKRRLGVLRTVFAKAIEEHDLSLRNPFEKLSIPKMGDDVEERDDFTSDDLQHIARACVSLNDTPRHIVAALMDTGARLSEIVGLRRSDVFLDAPVPYIFIREDKKAGRTLKTKSSTRCVPLAGMSLWSIKEAMRQTNGEWLFPQYATDGKIKGNSASATINKWLRPMTVGNKPVHSFRHTMETRLRTVGCPEDIMLTLGGWGTQTVARSYGKPHPVEVTAEWIQKVVIAPPI
jgi:integrase